MEDIDSWAFSARILTSLARHKIKHNFPHAKTLRFFRRNLKYTNRVGIFLVYIMCITTFAIRVLERSWSSTHLPSHSTPDPIPSPSPSHITQGSHDGCLATAAASPSLSPDPVIRVAVLGSHRSKGPRWLHRWGQGVCRPIYYHSSIYLVCPKVSSPLP